MTQQERREAQQRSLERLTRPTASSIEKEKAAAQQLMKQSQAQGEQGAKYMNKLSKELVKHQPYRRSMNVIVKAMNEYKKNAGLIEGRDPMEANL